ncbi:MAG: hypothetical protein LW875_12200 [Proteobacteria bacterium]|nr:hypothetical protein [Pseudomonadota bacterium]
MKLNSFMKGIVRSLAVVAILSEIALAQAPTENPSQVLTRTDASGLVLQTTLTKNLYRQEAQQVEYPEQVPYQVEEAYTDYETYYENEYRCQTRYENECSYEQECDYVNAPRCRRERVCTPRPSHPECRRVTECGTNAHGERICKDREVCDGRSVPDESCDYVERCDNHRERQCRNEYRCRNVPRERCGYEQVARTRPVTKYRTVTRYRTEMRCCRTEYRNVFDRQEVSRIELRFQPGSELEAGEVEQLRVSLVGGGAQAVSVTVETLTQLNGYRIVNQSNQGGLIVVELQQVPIEFTEAQVGAASVNDVRLKIREDLSAFVVFNDDGQKGRLKMVYEVVVRTDSGEVVASQQFNGNGLVAQKLELSQRLSLRRGHKLDLRVTRSGPGLLSPASFIKTFYRPG